MLCAMWQATLALSGRRAQGEGCRAAYRSYDSRRCVVWCAVLRQVKTLRGFANDNVRRTFLADTEKEWCIRMLSRTLVDFATEYDRCVDLPCLSRKHCCRGCQARLQSVA